MNTSSATTTWDLFWSPTDLPPVVVPMSGSCLTLKDMNELQEFQDDVWSKGSV